MKKKNAIRKLIHNPRVAVRYFLILTKYLKCAPDSLYLKLFWWSYFGYPLDLEHPKSFNEKMQWYKIYDRNPLFTVMVDKYEVKEYVASKIGREYVTPALGVWNSFDEIDFSGLPDEFVLKCTHDSGGPIICRDKSSFDYDAARQKISNALKRNYYWRLREWAYKDVKPRIIAEEYIDNDEIRGLYDYKVWCFNGKAKFIQYISGRLGKTTYEAFYDTNWSKQEFRYLNPLLKSEVPRPKNLDLLITLAEKLAENLMFGRIDFYILPDDSIRFGEITFYPNSGMREWSPPETNLMLGNMITLPKKS